jgi:hypothetical protein
MGSYERAEMLRRSFLPSEVRVLFIGESPPAGGTFFYARDSGLFRATRDAFYDAIPELRGGDFLRQFAALGCYLEDLCHEPVNHLNALERVNARRAGEPRLAKTLRDLRPRVVVILVKAIAPNVTRAVTAAGCSDVERHVVTYPSRWHRHRVAYRQELCTLLREFAGRRILCANQRDE